MLFFPFHKLALFLIRSVSSLRPPCHPNSKLHLISRVWKTPLIELKMSLWIKWCVSIYLGIQNGLSRSTIYGRSTHLKINVNLGISEMRVFLKKSIKVTRTFPLSQAPSALYLTFSPDSLRLFSFHPWNCLSYLPWNHHISLTWTSPPVFLLAPNPLSSVVLILTSLFFSVSASLLPCALCFSHSGICHLSVICYLKTLNLWLWTFWFQTSVSFCFDSPAFWVIPPATLELFASLSLPSWSHLCLFCDLKLLQFSHSLNSIALVCIPAILSWLFSPTLTSKLPLFAFWVNLVTFPHWFPLPSYLMWEYGYAMMDYDGVIM